MEKGNKKSIIFGIIIAILAIAAVIFVALFNSRDKEVPEEQLNSVTDIFEYYIFSMTKGYPTQYMGIDTLYSKDETKYEDLHYNAILNAAAIYASEQLDNSINNDVKAIVTNTYGYKDESTYTLFKGESIKEAVKILFGKDDFEHGTGINDGSFGYDFTYLYEVDLYVREDNNSLYVDNDEHFLDYKILDSKSLKDDKVEVTVAIAYVHKFDQKVIYTSDSKGNEVVFETTPTKYGIPDNKEDKFQKYTVTFKTDKNNKTYSFESIKKVK